MVKLGVNVDHVATVRQARRVEYPDPLEAAMAAEKAGADAITVHLREDRRHIMDRDLFRIASAIKIRINQELAPTEEMVEIALKVKPDEVCFVPERREELTTEGGLDVVALAERIIPMIKRLREARIGVSVFVEADQKQLAAAKSVGAQFVELHTGTYASLADQDLGEPKRRRNYELGEQAQAELQRIRDGAKAARALGLKVNAGHGLNYMNAGPIASITGLQWLHIGHAIVARAVMVGMAPAVREMKTLIAVASPARAIARSGTVLRK
jgi:pyridoxine 5-phosphate synthase